MHLDAGEGTIGRPSDRPPQSVIESNRLQVKKKAAMRVRTLRDLFTLSQRWLSRDVRPIGGGTALLRGRSASHAARADRHSEGLLSPAEEAFFCFMTMRNSQLCVTVTGRTMERNAPRSATPPTGADLVELRLDRRRPDVAGALEGRRGPVIVTCRAAVGGRALPGVRRGAAADSRTARSRRAPSSSTSRRRRTFAADLIARAPRPRRRRCRATTSASRPADLRERVRGAAPTGRRDRQARRRGAIAQRHAAAHAARSLGRRPDGTAGPRADRHGRRRASRRGCSPARLGNRWTYAGDGVAPGQISAAAHARRVPVPAHLRPDARSTASSATGRCTRSRRRCTTPASRRSASTPCTCRCEASDADDFVAFADALGLAGASITAPFKVHADGVAWTSSIRSRSASARSTRCACATAGGSAPTPTSTASSRR